MRNLIRRRPLKVEEVEVAGRTLRVPTLEAIARVKAWLCLMRNATRDYIDFAALSDRLGEERAAATVLSIDAYYADQVGPDGRRIAAQVAKQLAEPRPDDLSDLDLAVYRQLVPRWRDWNAIAEQCRRVALRALDALAVEPGADA